MDKFALSLHRANRPNQPTSRQFLAIDWWQRAPDQGTLMMQISRYSQLEQPLRCCGFNSNHRMSSVEPTPMSPPRRTCSSRPVSLSARGWFAFIVCLVAIGLVASSAVAQGPAPKKDDKKKKKEDEKTEKKLPPIEPIPEEMRKRQDPTMKIVKELMTATEVAELEGKLKKRQIRFAVSACRSRQRRRPVDQRLGQGPHPLNVASGKPIKTL